MYYGVDSKKTLEKKNLKLITRALQALLAPDGMPDAELQLTTCVFFYYIFL